MNKQLICLLLILSICFVAILFYISSNSNVISSQYTGTIEVIIKDKFNNTRMKLIEINSILADIDLDNNKDAIYKLGNIHGILESTIKYEVDYLNYALEYGTIPPNIDAKLLNRTISKDMQQELVEINKLYKDICKYTLNEIVLKSKEKLIHSSTIDETYIENFNTICALFLEITKANKEFDKLGGNIISDSSNAVYFKDKRIYINKIFEAIKSIDL